MQNERIILGIDPGSRKIGFGLISVSGKSIKYLSSGVINCEDQVQLEKYEIIKNNIEGLILKYKPDEIAMESLIYVKSPTALIKLAQARGVILSCLTKNYKNKFFEYSPNLVKSSAVGHGHADKLGVQKAITMILGIKEFKSDDESDALAVCLCHALNNGKVLVPSAKKSRGLSQSLSHKTKEI